jgi:hypothetical protein
MKSNHTQGALSLKTRDDCDYPTLLMGEGEVVADTMRIIFTSGPDRKAGAARARKNRDNARRLAACWNACEGLSTEALDSGETPNKISRSHQTALAKLGEMTAQRDELLAALEQPLTDDEFGLIYDSDCEDGWCGHDVTGAALQAIFRRVLSDRIAKAKGGAA